MKPRKPVSGSVSKSMEKVAAIQRQMVRERKRHSNKTASIAAQRDALRGVADQALRNSKLVKLRFDEIEEHQRHQAQVLKLQRRAREV